MKAQYTEVKSKMEKSISVLASELASIRAGRANPGVLDKITVDYYGVATPIPQVGTVSVPEARTIVIQPWDATILKEIEKSISASDLGINPNNDGKVIRLTFPPLTEERRKELVKNVKKIGEDSKVAIRAIRRDALEMFKKQQKASEITEDDLKGIEKDIQDMTDNSIKEIDEIVKKKEAEVLEV
ncbi:MAG: ribosome recycling factor [Clostridia bacterium]|nr:ribosome recycling factor [Clostridia bacterium]